MLSSANVGLFADVCGTHVGLDDFPQHENPADKNLYEPTWYCMPVAYPFLCKRQEKLLQDVFNHAFWDKLLVGKLTLSE